MKKLEITKIVLSKEHDEYYITDTTIECEKV